MTARIASPSPRRLRGLLLVGVLAIAGTAFALGASTAQATKYFDSFIGGTGATGGLFSTSNGGIGDVVVNQPSTPAEPQDGWIYVVDRGNHRVQVFNATGVFQFAIGRDVSGVNEQQRLTINATGGNYTLTFGGNTTANIAFNATGAQVATALAALPSIGTGNITGTGTATQPKVLTFTGALAGTDVAELTANTAGLTGGTQTVMVETLVTGAGGNVLGAEKCTVAAVCKIGVAGGLGGEFNVPQSIDIDQATGHFFVSERSNAGRRVQEFAADGTFVRAFGWDVVASGLGNGPGNTFETCNAAAGDICQSGTANGTAAGQFGSNSTPIAGLAVAPTDAPNAGELFVADPGSGTGNRRVLRFTIPNTSTGTVGVGTPIGATNNVGNPSSNMPAHVAVDSNGVVYMNNQNGGTGSMVLRYDLVANSYLDPIGNGSSGSFPGGDGSINALEIDAATGHLLVGRPAALGIFAFDLADKPSAVTTAQLVDVHIAGLGVDAISSLGVSIVGGRYYIPTSSTVSGTGTGQRLVVLDDSGVDPPPTFTLHPADGVGTSTATLRADIDPILPGPAFPTSYRFQVSKDGISWTDKTPDALVGGNGFTPTTVQNTISGLEPNTLYRYRVRTSRTPAAGVTFSAPQLFHTLPAPPSPETGAAQQVSDTGARLIGRLNPGGLDTSYWFEWGDDGYGNQAPVPAATATGGVVVTVGAMLSGLQPESVYHFRLCAQNSLTPTKVCGADATFATRSPFAADDGRAYEMVTSPDKVLRRGGGHGVVDSDTDYMRFAAGLPSFGGDELLWAVYAGASDPEAGSGYSYDYGFEVRRRQDRDGDGKADGWYGDATVNVPPAFNGSGATNVFSAVSTDLETQSWAMRVPMFSTSAQAATRVMGDDGGPRAAGWYPWLDPAWFSGSLQTDFDLSSYIDDQGERLIGWNNAPGNQHYNVTAVEDSLSPAELTPAQTAGTALFLADGEHDWKPTDLVNECSGTGADATLIPSRNDGGTDAGPAGTWHLYASFANASTLLTIDFPNSQGNDTVAPTVGHAVSGPGIQPGTTVVAVGSGTITISAPTTEAAAPGAFTHELAGGQNTAALANDTIAARPCGAGSPTDVRGAVLGGKSGSARLRGATTLAMSDSGDRVFTMSPDPDIGGTGQSTCGTLAGAATACPAQVFVRQYDDDGNPTVRWLSRADDQLFGAPQPISLFGNGAVFEGASRDGRVVYFRTNAPLTADDPNGVKDGGGNVVAPPPGGIVTGTASPISWDLYRYDLPADNNDDPTGPEAGGLTRISGGPDQSADPNTNCASAAANCGGDSNGAGSVVRFLSDDAERAYFVTSSPIEDSVPGVDTWNEPPLNGATGVCGEPAGNVSTRDLYLYNGHESGDDAYKFVACVAHAPVGEGLDSCTTANPSGAAAARRAAENTGVGASLRPTGGSCVHGSSLGDAITFETTTQLTFDDVDNAGDVYMYDALGDELSRVSARPPGAQPYVCITTNDGVPLVLCNGDLGIATIATSGAQAGGGGVPGSTVGQAGMRHHNIAENPDGSFKALFFESRHGYVDGDTNGDHMDVYQWSRDGRLRLLSPGDSDRSAFFTGNSRDGRDVFFWTEQRISAWEVDVADGDVYDARVGGGLPDPVVPPPVCAVLVGGCQAGGGSLGAPTRVTDSPGNGNVNPGARPVLTLGALTAAKRAAAARSGVLTLRVRTTRGGRLTAAARAKIGKRRKGVGRASSRIDGPGTATLKVTLNDAARRALRANRRLAVTVTVSLPGARSRTATVLLRRAGR